MDTHLSVLPTAIVEALASKINQSETRFMTLLHPRTNIPSLFLSYHTSVQASANIDNKSVILEIQSVSPPNARSWFLDQQVVADGKMLVMTPLDPVFLVIPILQAVNPNGASLFRPLDDIFEDGANKLQENATKDIESSVQISREDILHLATLDCVHSALKRVCEVKEITSEIVVYKYSPEKLLVYLRAKVNRLANAQTFELSKTLIRGLAKDGLMEDGKEELLQDGRLKNSCDLVAQYVSSEIRDSLIASYDLHQLTAYLGKLTAAEEAAAATATGPLKKTKAKSKETKASEEKKRKNTNRPSQGVEKLKRVNTDNMSKLSSFFTKKE